MCKNCGNFWFYTSKRWRTTQERDFFQFQKWVFHSLHCALSFVPLLVLPISLFSLFLLFREMLRDTIKEGKIVPSEVTVSLIKKEIEASENDKFLIDGFPRSEDNRVAFEHIVSFFPFPVLDNVDDYIFPSEIE